MTKNYHKGNKKSDVIVIFKHRPWKKNVMYAEILYRKQQVLVAES